MRRILLLMVLVLSTSFTMLAQEVNTKANAEVQSNSTAINFLSKDGSFFQRAFYPIDKIGGTKIKNMNTEVVIINDLTNNSKIGCLRLTTYSFAVSYSSTLDPDELDACANCLEYISNNVINTQPETYTEYSYITKDGVKIGVYRDVNGKPWTIAIQTKKNIDSSSIELSPDQLPAIIANIKLAKQFIDQHTK